MNFDDDYYEYRLVGINIHRGNGQSGHYWSFIHTQRGQLEPDPAQNPGEWYHGIDKDWKRFDDGDVSSYNPQNIGQDAFGGSGAHSQFLRDMQDAYGNDYGENAYMLIYEKKVKKSIRQISKDAAG